MATCRLPVELKSKLSKSSDYFPVTKSRQSAHLTTNDQWIVERLTDGEQWNIGTPSGLGF